MAKNKEIKEEEEKVQQLAPMDLDCFLNLSLVSGYQRTYYIKHYGGKERLETLESWSKITKLPLPKLGN